MHKHHYGNGASRLQYQDVDGTDNGIVVQAVERFQGINLLESW